ncbi:hypothetical protein [Blastococcus capsensis]|uniref:hypothetical protein n=1 Tax=Blastococcus capsensis TaxID=1564163 RepID=UPI0025415D32|nr:hypothetical protein [Blastococcus capsensis]MDK3258829.1 hypothetical protein [Blastococcus capsensis]
MRSALRSVVVATSAVVALLGAPATAGAAETGTGPEAGSEQSNRTERAERELAPDRDTRASSAEAAEDDTDQAKAEPETDADPAKAEPETDADQAEAEPEQDEAGRIRSGTSIGYDVSYPQCGIELPEDRAFAIVGVNGGLSTRANPCLSAQLVWAHDSSGRVDDQPAAQLYLNTANPGQVLDLVTTWPSDGDTPYGDCDGGNSPACSWQYGWERAENSAVSFLRPAARSARVDSQPSRYTWWLDVETMNTWQIGSDDARDRNRATLEGMTAYLLSKDAEVGVYSTGYQWGRIVGEVPEDSDLAGLDSWLAGADDLDDARDTCDDGPLVPGGRVTLVQYVEDDLDHNHACR